MIPTTDQDVIVARQDLLRFVAAIFHASGMSGDDAATVADVLVWADARGVDSHGVSRIPRYLEFIRRGDLDPRARPMLDRRTAASFVLRAARAAGPVAMREAINHATETARRSGVALGVVGETTHTGAIGYYAKRAAEDGFAAIVAAAGPPMMAYFGARVPGVSTSPLAIAVPGRRHGPLLLDMATSVAALGRIKEAAKAGRPLPEGWALAADGTPTTDAAKAATALPLGGAKGSGLSLMIECLTGLMAGAPILAPRLRRQGEGRHLQNATVILMDIAAFRPLDEFQEDVDELADLIKALPRQAGVNDILLPGERGGRMAALTRSSGIVVSRTTWRSLCNVAETLRLQPPAGLSASN
jgi:ureidoglycolate dehydrogenase (NAD+)